MRFISVFELFAIDFSFISKYKEDEYFENESYLNEVSKIFDCDGVLLGDFFWSFEWRLNW